MSKHFIKTTEKDSVYNNLELKSTREILSDINQEDKTVAYIIEKNIQRIEILVDNVYEKLQNGGRLFYIGSGTSGRLGILDASECPPTFGVDSGLVIGIIAGGAVLFVLSRRPSYRTLCTQTLMIALKVRFPSVVSCWYSQS